MICPESPYIVQLCISLREFCGCRMTQCSLARRYEREFMPKEANDAPNLLSPGEVAELFRVDPKTVTRWAKAGKLSPVKTLGGHRRYHSHEVHELLRKIQEK